jgi:FkbM family methyltransferase
MNDELIRVRECLRHPTKFLIQFARQPGKYGRAFLRHARQVLFGSPQNGVPPAQPLDIPVTPIDVPVSSVDVPLTSVDVPVSSVDVPLTSVDHAWPNLGLWPWESPVQIVPAKMPNGKPWPRITIVTPSYQQGEFIEKTIRSVLLQGYPNLEYIVVDGGSTDSTQVILRRYGSEVDHCISEADEGQAAAINKGFQHSTGEILGWLNSDDMHLPSTLVEVALAFERAKALAPTYPVDLICGRALIYSERDNAIINEHRSKFPCGISKLPVDINDFDGVWQKSPGFFFQPEVFFTLKVWKRVGSSLNPFLQNALDYDLWIRMAKSETYLYSTDSHLAIFRIHDKQKTKFGNGITYPEHQAVSLFHRQNAEPDAFYLPEEYVPKRQDTIPPNIFSTKPVSYHETALGNYYLPCAAPNDIIARCMRAGRVFEPLVLETARQCIRSGTIVLDVGAAFGQMAILFSHLAGGDGMVFSFEAQEYCFAILQRNIRANYRENVRAIFGAVMDGSRAEVFFPMPDFHRFPTYGSYAVELEPGASKTCAVKTLAIDELRIDHPISFFKIDTQGSDLFVLRGARETILRHQMPILFEYEQQFQEEFGTTFEDYLDFVKSINYRIKEVVDGINYLIVPDPARTIVNTPSSPSTFRAGNSISGEASFKSDIIAITDAPFRHNLCKYLKTQTEIEECTRYLHRNGYVSHNLACKNWDLAHIVPEIGHGNVLDMGSSDSYILKNMSLKRTKGKKYGIDRYDPDVPISDVTYFKGDLLQTPLADGSLDYITCLSVIEHQVDFKLFAQEVNRLLVHKGKLFVTFDYWDPLLSIPVRPYDLDWQPLDQALTLAFIGACKDHGLHLVREMDWTTQDQVIHWGYYSPHRNVSYTFGMLAFEKS